MLRKVLTATIVLTLVGTIGTVSYSEDVINNNSTSNCKDTYYKFYFQKNIEVFHPQNNLITSDKNILLSGKTDNGNKIIVEIYSTPNITLNDYSSYNFNFLSKIENEKENLIYLPPIIKEIEIGAFGIFAEELELKLGLNKINVYIEGSNYSEVKYVYVNDISKAEEILESIDNVGFFNSIKQMFIQEKLNSAIEHDESINDEEIYQEDSTNDKDNLDSDGVILEDSKQNQ